MAVSMEEAGKTANQMRNNQDVSHETTENEEQEVDRGDDWLQIARDAYRNSTDYFDSSIRKVIERNLAHFNNRHAPGSKYYSDAYKYRAKGFRPKTRSIIRKNEAQAAVALFSTSDSVYVAPENDSDEAQVISAAINQELLQYRLTNTIPWFRVALGAYQDAMTTGVVVSHQYWKFEEVFYPDDPLGTTKPVNADGEEIDEDQGVFEAEDENGEPSGQFYIIKDTPDIEIRPIENFRFSPNADWCDPINSSPFLIDRLPMTIGDVKQMTTQLGKTMIPWYQVDDGMLQKGLTDNYDPIRNAREGNREDPHDRKYHFSDFDTVWVHRNIVRKHGLDWIYYTLGEYAMLSDPIPLREEYPWLPMGGRPYVMGTSVIETHKNYPQSPAGLASNLQQEANDINNQRRDNVQLVLNRRNYVRRGAQIDYRTLTRSIPGGVVEMDDPNKDIKTDAPADVTASSYQEQDRINLDFDELTGSFSSSSIGSNRQLNETVGGMEMLSQSADAVTEYQLRTFVETWVEPVLRQVIQLEQYYESDPAVYQMIGERAKVWQRYGLSEVTDKMLQGSMSVEVNVGFGVTNPKQRIERMALGLNTVLQYQPQMAQRLNGEEIAKEVFGALGYKGHTRFFPEPDPNAPPPEQQPDPNVVAEQMRLEGNMQLEKLRFQNQMQVKELEKQMKIAEMQGKAMDSQQERQFKMALAQLELQGDMIELAGRKEMSLDQIKAKMSEFAMRERGQNERFLAERQFALGPGQGRGL